VEELFDVRTIAAPPWARPLGEKPRPLPQAVPWKGGVRPLEQVLAKTHTNAFLMLCHGELVHEWYREPAERDTRQSSWSVAKSVVSLLVGQLIAEGRLSEDTRLVAVLPEFATQAGFDRVTVQQLLDMESGIDVREDYATHKPFTGVGGLQMATDLPGYLMRNRELYFIPGSRSIYRSVDSQYLSMIVSRLEGAPLASVVERRLWRPMGAEGKATWNLDHADGTEKGFGNLNALPRDFARLGLLMAEGGKVNGQTLVPEAWMERIARPVAEAEPGWMYAAQWWHPPGYRQHRDFTALGVYGQYVYVNPARHAVVVKLSDHGAEQDEADLIEVFRALAQRCH
jgi:CubicO group peptidase (beta-lactamase class C family)